MERYEFRKLIATGGEGEVYQAYDRHLNKEVAIKKYTVIECNKIVTDIQHENFPRILDIIRLEDAIYVVMDFIKGRSLYDIVVNGPMDECKAIEIILQVCRAIQYLHNRDEVIIHGDINPRNVFIEDDGKVKLIDYNNGINSNDFKGMVGFASPEQYGYGDIDVLTDIYGIGCLFYFILTGEVVSVNELGLIKSIDSINNDISMEVVHIIHRCIQPVKSQRYQNIDSLISDLKGEKKKTSANTIVINEDISFALKMAYATCYEKSKGCLIISIGGISELLILLYPDIFGSSYTIANNAAVITTITTTKRSIKDFLNPISELSENIYHLGCGQLDLSTIDIILEKCRDFDYIYIVADYICNKQVLNRLYDISYMNLYVCEKNFYSLVHNFNYMKFLTRDKDISEKTHFIIKEDDFYDSADDEKYMNFIENYKIKVHNINNEIDDSLFNKPMTYQEIFKYQSILEQ